MWIKKTNLTVYVSHFLSCWGTHMWIFGMGMFLVRIADDDLQLSATYGLATGLAIFLFGPLVGHWVDSTPRLKAAQLSLVLQDAVRLACAALIAVYLWYQSSITNIWLFPLLQASIVALGVLSNLASQARMLAVERDWIIEICGRDSDLLATMTAAMRRIDQVGMILSPIATGQVIFYSGLMYGAIFIGAWNASSVFVESYLTWKVYNVVPALNQKKDSCRNNVELPIILDSKDKLENDSGSLVTPLDLDLEVEGHKEERTKMVNSQMSTCGRVLFQFVTLYRGWRTYMRYSVALAGLALACLYMTVLGFDSITVAYAANQGLSESVLGILMGSSAIFGIIGTFAYPIIRHRVGLVRTGLIALSCEVSCLTLCVASIWMPGSPFDPTYRKAGHTSVCNKVNTSVSLACTEVLAMASENSTSLFASTSAAMNATSCNTSAMHCIDSYISVIFLMAGIFLARFGLWVADLTITQLFLQQVEETERGLVNGVQSSLNQLMDLLKFALVVALPDMETFGFLILLSFVFIAAGWSLYAIFVRRESRSNSRGVSC